MTISSATTLKDINSRLSVCSMKDFSLKPSVTCPLARSTDCSSKSASIVRHGVSLHNIEIDLEYRPKITAESHSSLAQYNGPLAEKSQILAEAKAIDSVFSV